MKKLSKILLLLLCVALCVTGVVLAVSANDDSTAEYATPALDPALAGEGYTYFVYEDEAKFLADIDENGYVDGSTALAEGGKMTDTNLTVVGASPNYPYTCDNYYYVLTDVTHNTAENYGAAVINLGGKNMTVTAQLQPAQYAQAVTLKVINGTIVDAMTGTAELFEANPNSTLILDGITITQTGTATGAFIYDRACTNITVTNTTVTGIARSRFIEAHDISDFMSNDDTSNANTTGTNTFDFENFKLYGVPLYAWTSGNAGYLETTINIGTDCVFEKTLLSGFVSTYKDSWCKLSWNLNIETGVLMSDVEWLSIINGAYKGSLSVGSGDAKLYANLDSETSADYPYTVVDGAVTVGDTPLLHPSLKDQGYTYFVYANETEFLSDIDEYGYIDGSTATAKHTDTNLTVNRDKYHFLLQNVTKNTSTNTETNDYEACTVNLGGKAITVSSRWRPSQYTHAFTLKIFNGKLIDATEGTTIAIVANANSSIILEDLIITKSGSSTAEFIHNIGATELTLRNVTADVTGKAAFVESGYGATSTTVNFENVDLTGAPLYIYDKSADNEITATVNVDADCSFNNAEIFAVRNWGETANVKHVFNVDAGVKMTSKAWLDTVAQYSDYVTVNYVGGTTAYTGVYANVGDATYAYVVTDPDAIVNWRNADGTLIGSDLYVAGETPANAHVGASAGTTYTDIDGVLYKTTITESGWTDVEGAAEAITIPAVADTGAFQTINYYHAKSSENAPTNEFTTVIWNADGSFNRGFGHTTLSAGLIGYAVEGGTVKIYANAVDMDTTLAPKNNMTLDLNGYTFTCSNSSWKLPTGTATFTIKNGNIVMTGKNIVKNDESYRSGTIIFDGVNITTDTKLVQIDFGNVKLNDCEVTHTGTDSVFDLGEANYNFSISVELKDTTLTSATTESVFYLNVAGKYSGNYYKSSHAIDVQNSTVNCTAEKAKLIYFYQCVNYDKDTTVTVNVADAYINVDTFINNRLDFTWYDSESGESAADAALTQQNINYTVSNTFFKKDFDHVPAERGTLTLTGAKMLINDDVYGAYVGMPEASKWQGSFNSLTLYSDFTLNFYIPVTNTDIVAINGVAVEDWNDFFTDDNGNEFYFVRVVGIKPNTAASYATLNITYNTTLEIDGETTAVECTVTVKTSVLAYAETLLKNPTAVPEDVREESVNTVTAMLAYIDAAYAHFAGNNDTVSDAKLANKLALLVADYPLADPAPEGDADDIGVAELQGVQMAFRIDTITKLYVKVPEGVTFTLKNDGKKVVLKESDHEDYDYMVSFRACDLCDLYTVEVTNGTVRDTATFSFGEYAAEVAIPYGGTIAEIAKAMYAYGVYAAALNEAMTADAPEA